MKHRLRGAGVDFPHDATLEQLQALWVTPCGVQVPYTSPSGINVSFNLIDRTTRRHPSPPPPGPQRTGDPNVIAAVDPKVIQQRFDSPRRTRLTQEELQECRDIKDRLYRLGADGIRHDATLQELRDLDQKPRGMKLTPEAYLLA